MKINTLSVFPEIIKNNCKYGVLSKAVGKKLITINNYSFFTEADKNRGIDDEQYGHNPGMVISFEKTYKIFKKIKKNEPKTKFIFLTPKGQTFNNQIAKNLSNEKNITIVSGRYEGFDERILEEFCDFEISIGDYILTGGELAACILIDSISRMIKGVVGKKDSVTNDSFMDSTIKGPVYTKPKIFKNKSVPKILLSGNHKNIDNFNRNNSLEYTLNKREDLLENAALRPNERENLRKIKKSILNNNVFIALVHHPIKNIKNEIITTSLTNLDIQDIARSARTYGINKYYITHPILEQRKLAEKVLSFWDSEKKRKNENSKHVAMNNIIIKKSLKEAISNIKKEYKQKPILIGTDANQMKNMVDYSFIKHKIQEEKRPYLIVFGTGWGLSQEIIESCDYILKPVGGYDKYNHLSVRSAVAIILDKLFGCNF